MTLPRSPRLPSRRAVAALAAVATTSTSLIIASGMPALATPVSCGNGSTPAMNVVVTCSRPTGHTDLLVPNGATTLAIDLTGGGGGAGLAGSAHKGGDAAHVTANVALPATTHILRVIVGHGGAASTVVAADVFTHGIGGGGSGVFALDASGGLVAKLAIAGGGGGGSLYGNGGDAGQSGTTATYALNGGGGGAQGSSGGAGGWGVDSYGATGGSDDPATPTVAAGGAGGEAGYGVGGSGGGGYGGGGGGGVGQGGDRAYYWAAGGGGSSFVTASATDVQQQIATGSGGVAGRNASTNGSDGSAEFTFTGERPAAPTGVVAKAKDRAASVSFTAPTDHGSAPVTGYRVTTQPGGTHISCPASPCTVEGLTNGRGYSFTVAAISAAGDSPASTPSAVVVPRSAPKAAVKPTLPRSKPWFVDPLTPTQRKHLAAVPRHPQATHGKPRTTRAAYRTGHGRLAVPPRALGKHQLSKGQAVQLTTLFRFDSSSLSPAGRKAVRRIASHLTTVKALTCEGYADYAGRRRHEFALAKQRAVVVCRVLARFTGADVRTVSYGPDRPLVVGGTPRDRGANRRVDVVVTR